MLVFFALVVLIAIPISFVVGAVDSARYHLMLWKERRARAEFERTHHRVFHPYDPPRELWLTPTIKSTTAISGRWVWEPKPLKKRG